MTGTTVQRDHAQYCVNAFNSDVHHSHKSTHTDHINPNKDSCLNNNKSLHKQPLLSADDPVKPDELSHA